MSPTHPQILSPLPKPGRDEIDQVLGRFQGTLSISSSHASSSSLRPSDALGTHVTSASPGPFLSPTSPSSSHHHPQHQSPQPTSSSSGMNTFLLSRSRVVKILGLPVSIHLDAFTAWLDSERAVRGRPTERDRLQGVWAEGGREKDGWWVIFEDHPSARNCLGLSGSHYLETPVTVSPALESDLDRCERLVALPTLPSSFSAVTAVTRSLFLHHKGDDDVDVDIFSNDPFQGPLDHYPLDPTSPSASPPPPSSLLLSSLHQDLSRAGSSYPSPTTTAQPNEGDDASGSSSWFFASDFHHLPGRSQATHTRTSISTVLSPLSPPYSPVSSSPSAWCTSSSSNRFLNLPLLPSPPNSAPSLPDSFHHFQQQQPHPTVWTPLPYQQQQHDAQQQQQQPPHHNHHPQPPLDLDWAAVFLASSADGTDHSTLLSHGSSPTRSSTFPFAAGLSESASPIWTSALRPAGGSGSGDRGGSEQPLDLSAALGGGGGATFDSLLVQAQALAAGMGGPGQAGGTGNVGRVQHQIPLTPTRPGMAVGGSTLPRRSSQSGMSGVGEGLAPIVNTGNSGHMVIQQGDWACGECGFVNWRRRRVCLRCFPFAEGNELAGVGLATSALLAAELARLPDSPLNSEAFLPATPSSMATPSSTTTSSSGGASNGSSGGAGVGARGFISSGPYRSMAMAVPAASLSSNFAEELGESAVDVFGRVIAPGQRARARAATTEGAGDGGVGARMPSSASWTLPPPPPRPNMGNARPGKEEEEEEEEEMHGLR